MKFINNLWEKFKILPRWTKWLIAILVVGGLGGVGFQKILNTDKTTTQIQTEKVTKGNLVTTITGSGTITAGNSTNIKTAASGTVVKVYVKNGDTVTKGQKIADLTLDTEATKKRSNAWVAYLSAKEEVKTAEAAKVTADIDMWEYHQAHLTALDTQTTMSQNDTNPKTNRSYTATERMVIEKTVDEAYKNFKAAELKYQNADAAIANARVKVTAAWEDYQQYSATIVAPTAGVVNNLVLAPGIMIDSVVSTSTTTTADTISSQTIGIVSNSNNQFQATINLTETDITKIKADQKVSLTVDAFSDKTFTGKVLAINTSGSSTSGVTSYPVTVLFDPTTVNIYTKMAVSATIITNINNEVLLVSNSAIETTAGNSYVAVKKDGKTSQVEITIGDSDGTKTVVTGGLNEGDEVVISSLSANSASNDNTSSPFSSTNRSSDSNSRNTNFGGMGAGFPPGGF